MKRRSKKMFLQAGAARPFRFQPQRDNPKRPPQIIAMALQVIAPDQWLRLAWPCYQLLKWPFIKRLVKRSPLLSALLVWALHR